MTEDSNIKKNEDDEVSLVPTQIKLQKILAIWNVGILVILTVLVLLTYLKAPISILASGNQTIQILIYTASAGGIGGSLYNMRTFTTVPESIEKYFAWYLLFPIGSIFFGLFSYVLVAGGVLVLSGGEPTTKEFISTTILFYCGLAFLAGFATNQFISKLKDLADVFFSPETPG